MPKHTTWVPSHTIMYNIKVDCGTSLVNNDPRGLGGIRAQQPQHRWRARHPRAGAPVRIDYLESVCTSTTDPLHSDYRRAR